MASLCNICLEPYNRNTHKEIKCEKCNFICCKTCIKILFTNNPKCMICNNYYHNFKKMN